jgi:hypothetical protein
MDRRRPDRRALLGGIAGIALGGVLGGRVAPALAAPATPAARTQKRLGKQSALRAGLKAISVLQDASGGFAYPGSSVDPRATADVVSMMIALRNAGVEVDLAAAVAYVQQTDPVAWADSQSVTLTDSEVARIVMALVAAGGDPRAVGGNDLVARLVAGWDAKAAIYGSALWEVPSIVMALVVAGKRYMGGATATLAAAQLADGSWSSSGDTQPGSGDPWTTAWVIQGLVAAGRGGDAAVANAVAYLHTAQGDDGAFGTSPGWPADSRTTGTVVSALLAAGENPKAREWNGVVDALLAFQDEQGAFRQDNEGGGEDFDGTVAALIALAGAYWPVVPIA